MDSKSNGGLSVDGVISQLVETLFDKEEAVSNAVANSVHILGQSQPNVVVSCCMSHLRKESKNKSGIQDRLKLFTVIEKICEEVVENIDLEIRATLLDYCIAEITRERAPQTGCEKIANHIVVLIGTKYENEVMDKLFTRFDPSFVPSFFMVKTLGDLASANPFGMVPFLKALLGTMLPMLGIVKQDSMKYVFAYTLASFAESIQEYLANIDKAPDTDVNTDYFNTEFGSACDVLLDSWLQTRDLRTKEQVVKALGIISPLLNESKLDVMAPKLITSLLHLYRKHNIPLPMMSNDIEMCHVSQSLAQVLEVIQSSNHRAVITTMIDNILSTLFLQVCIVPDYQLPSSLRNHNEILRCFATLTLQNCDAVLPFLLQKLDSNSESVKIGALTVIKHLLNACSQTIAHKIASILFALRLVLNDETNKVKKIVIQVIVAIAHHGYLCMNNGQALIQYIIKQCALTVSVSEEGSVRRSSVSDDRVTNEAVKGMAENVMILLVTTVENIEDVLWPHLFEYLTCLEFVAAVPTVCTCLASMGQKLKADETLMNKFNVDFSKETSLPKAESLMARLCVLIGDDPSSNVVIPALKLMKVISSLINTNLEPLWDTVIMQFLSRLNENSEITLRDWQKQCLAFVNQSLIEIDDQQFTYRFGKTLLKQMHLYNFNAKNKSFFLLVLGSVVRRLAVKDFTTESIEVIFSHLDHSDELEQSGCSYAVGQCAANHLDLVLVKLEQLAEGKKSGNFMNMLLGSVRPSAAVEHERLKSTVILCYGSVTKYAPAQLLITRIETPILRTLASFYEGSKELFVKSSFLKAVAVIANSLHPENLQEKYVFRRRNELLEEMLKILKDFHSSELQVELSLEAIAKLVRLDPALSQKDKEKLVNVSCKAVLPSVYSSKVSDSFYDVLKQVLVKDKSDLETLLLLINLLRKWITTPSTEQERKNAISTILHLLEVYFNNIEPTDFKRFDCFPTLIGIFIPRLFDKALSIHQVAFDAIKMVCGISNKLQGRTKEEDDFVSILVQLQTVDEEVGKTCLHNLSMQLCKRIKERNHNLLFLIEVLINSLPEAVPESSVGAAHILSFVVDFTAPDLKVECPTITSLLKEVLPFISSAEARMQAYNVVRKLSGVHLPTVCDCLLNTPLPFSEVVVDIWKNLAQDTTVCITLIDWLLELLLEDDLIETQRKQPNAAALRPLAALCALNEIFSLAAASGVAKARFEDAFTTILIIIATYVDVERIAIVESPTGGNKVEGFRKASVKQPANSLKPVQFAIQTMQSLLHCTAHLNVISSIADETWQAIERKDAYPDAIGILLKPMCTDIPSSVPNIVKNLTQHLGNVSPYCRLTAVACFTEVLSLPPQCKEKKTLTEPLVNTLLNTLSDPSPLVRKMCIRGLGRFYSHPPEHGHKFSKAVVSALINGLEDSNDSNDEIVLESLKGLLNALNVIEMKDVSDLMVPLALRLRTNFDKNNSPIQASSIQAFGKLAALAKNVSPHPMIDQAYSSLIPLLIYLNDSEDEITEATKYTLRTIGPVFGIDEIQAHFGKSLTPENPIHYSVFVGTLSKLLISHMPEKLNDFIATCLVYLKGEKLSCQCSSVILLGFLLGNQPREKRNTDIQQKVISSLMSLLRYSTITDVRVKAAESISLM